MNKCENKSDKETSENVSEESELEQRVEEFGNEWLVETIENGWNVKAKAPVLDKVEDASSLNLEEDMIENNKKGSSWNVNNVPNFSGSEKRVENLPEYISSIENPYEVTSINREPPVLSAREFDVEEGFREGELLDRFVSYPERGIRNSGYPKRIGIKRKKDDKTEDYIVKKG